ncbi:MAG: chromosome partitioning protein ParB, partial [Actinomycetota bacterium]
SGHARALLGLSERSAQAELAARIVADELSVRQTEEIVRRGRVDGGGGPATLGSGAGTVGEAGLREIEHVLSERLSTRVRASLAKGRGRLVIEFADLDDLDRIYRELS